MHRTQIYLPDEAYLELQALSRRSRHSLAELIRQAVDRYLTETRRESRLEKLREGFGLWSDLEKTTAEVLTDLRSGWNRHLAD